MHRDHETRLLLANGALAAAARKPWKDVTIFDIAAGGALEAFAPATPGDALDAIEEMFDRAMAQGLTQADTDSLVRDRLFDLAMRRFEAMEPHRKALISIDEAIEREPALRATFHARIVRTARWTLALAALNADGVTGVARANGLALILTQARAAWRRDDAGDFARTMAALDKALRQAEQTFGKFGGFEGKPTGPTAAAAPDAA
jgi:hypothetical protein